MHAFPTLGSSRICCTPGWAPVDADSGKNGCSRDARINVEVLFLSAGSGGIWTKWSSSEAEVPMYRLLSKEQIVQSEMVARPWVRLGKLSAYPSSQRNLF